MVKVVAKVGPRAGVKAAVKAVVMAAAQVAVKVALKAGGVLKPAVMAAAPVAAARAAATLGQKAEATTVAVARVPSANRAAPARCQKARQKRTPLRWPLSTPFPVAPPLNRAMRTRANRPQHAADAAGVGAAAGTAMKRATVLA